MADGNPQNPAFPVNAASLEVCAQRVICPACGTVITVRPRREDFRRRCTACPAMLRYRLEGLQWVVVVEEAEA